MVGTTLAIAAVPAWHNLLRDAMIANLQSRLLSNFITQLYYLANELMTRNDGRLTIRLSVLVTLIQIAHSQIRDTI